MKGLIQLFKRPFIQIYQGVIWLMCKTITFWNLRYESGDGKWKYDPGENVIRISQSNYKNERWAGRQEAAVGHASSLLLLGLMFIIGSATVTDTTVTAILGFAELFAVAFSILFTDHIRENIRLEVSG